MNFSALTEQAVAAALAAGKLIQSYCDRDVEVLHKDGGDTLASQVVTEVDQKAQDLILEHLLPTCSAYDLALLTEESEDDGRRFEKEYFWCIDPMDGTLSFVQRSPGYSVAIGLVARDGSPQIGVVYDPVQDILYQAVRGQGVRRNEVSWRPAHEARRLTFTYDRSLTDHPSFETLQSDLDDYARSRGLDGVVALQHGGSVMNACHALEQAPACHFKFPKASAGGGSVWDYAATACLYEEAGAVVSDVYGDPLDLNRADSTFMNHRGAVYATDVEIAERVRKLIAEWL